MTTTARHSVHDRKISQALAVVVRQRHNPTAHYNLGCALHHAGRLEEAVMAYRQALVLAPHGPARRDAGANLGAALLILGRSAEAVPFLKAEADHAPSSADAQLALSAALAGAGAAPAAIMAARRAAQLAPHDPACWLQLAHACREGGDSHAAIVACQQALALAPADGRAQLALAASLQEHGETDAARQAANAALAAQPDSAPAWMMLAGLERFGPNDPRIAMMAQLAARLATMGQEDDAIIIGFALGKARMDAGDTDGAFAALAEANRRHRARISYDAAADLATLTAITRGLDAATLARLNSRQPPAQAPDVRPIFIVGMPRSGTTLVEQILAAHPAVVAGGEMKHLDLVLYDAWGGVPTPAAWATHLGALDAAMLRAWRQDYLRRAMPQGGGGTILTDKMPSNFRHIGLIHLIFPEAVIIDCRRDPLDTCLSCFATYFAQGQGFTYDLAELGAYYHTYAHMMDHWHTVLPAGRLITVHYEALVMDFAAQTRRLLDACNLPWHDACLAFHRTVRPVRTASVNQVRQPLYTGSLGRAQAYKHHLAPLWMNFPLFSPPPD